MELKEIIEMLKERINYRRERFVNNPWLPKGDQKTLRAYNDILGITRLDREIKSRSEIEEILLFTATKLQSKLENRVTLPTVQEIRYIYDSSLEVEDYQRIKDFNDYYPMLEFCYDERFLIFTNYVLTRTYASQELKKDLSELAKNIIECSETMEPIRGINRVKVTDREYEKLCKFTLKTIKQFEKEEKKNGIARRLGEKK